MLAAMRKLYLCACRNVFEKIPFPYTLYCLCHKKKDKTFYCPCCGKKLVSFVPMPSAWRKGVADAKHYPEELRNVMCINCRSLPRHRILAYFLGERLEELRKAKILYFAPETWLSGWAKRNNIQFTSADLFFKEDLKLDVTNMDLPDQSFDVIVVSHILEHVDDVKKALSELRRVLTRDGYCLITFPIDPSLEKTIEDKTADEYERIERFGQIDHLRLFGRDARQIVEGGNFSSVEIIDGNDMPENIKPCIGPADYDTNIFFLCRK